MKKQILFVDDEPNILSGLRRMVRSMREEFDCLCATSGREALEILDKNQVDIVVSDMRMPGMDGAELLTLVKKLHPRVIRIMLTGYADDKSVLRTIGVVHQFLSKPCLPEEIRASLVRAGATYDLMSDSQLKELISGIGSLPSLPSLYVRLQKALQDPDTTQTDVAAIIETDISMTAKILQLVNSAFFGLYQKVSSVSRAVNLLGLDTIKALVLGTEIFSELHTSSKVFSVDSLWNHSMATGAFARKIAALEYNDREMAEDAFLGGILHDIGKLVLISFMPARFEEAVLLAREKEMVLVEAERQVFGAGHDDVGAYLVGLWGLPGSVVEACCFHHRLERFPGQELSPVLAIHVADVLSHQLHPDEIIGTPSGYNTEYLARLDLSDRVESWHNLCLGEQ
ncbi:signal transduction protein [Desulfolithobacter dissulfuricans]|uniref:Signal transduction protein n=1 Tax=Desulfolithobacter dissulfuricans TaxID=2795293 RepID=A0A915U8Q2_9BACT|nr:response regulator [Desulfolithobacter dissulfuricans]BCO08226.1 signal transduction protein [Desulfolithobacter dissulfuricans]